MCTQAGNDLLLPGGRMPKHILDKLYVEVTPKRPRKRYGGQDLSGIQPPSTSGNDDLHAKLDRIEKKLDRLLKAGERSSEL